ncbi:MAG: cytochrome c [Gammaproteobacteria bacterium]
MTFSGHCTRAAAILIGAGFVFSHPVPAIAQDLSPAAEAAPDPQSVARGKKMYMQGVLPSGEIMTATVHGDINLTGEQVICGACHRRSGMGSTEGQDVVPAVTGDILYEPLRLPTTKPPLPPARRPAYSDETLKRAIRDGIGADGEPFSPLMPRYPLSDAELESMVAFLKTLNTEPDPGVTEKEIHFATVIADSVEPEQRKALVDVLNTFVEQKNVETRNESQRAEHAPWHKHWIFGPYRKWNLHVWELQGPQESWPEQLKAQYQEQPVFALLSGLVPGSWQPVRDFCEGFEVPCLFPITDLPVIDEQDFYSVYFSKGMTVEGEGIVQNLADDGLLNTRVVQVYRAGDARGTVAAAALERALEARGGQAEDVPLTDLDAESMNDFWSSVVDQGRGAVMVLWLSEADTRAFWQRPGADAAPARIYLSTTLYGSDLDQVPASAREQLRFVHPYEMPDKLNRLLIRSTGWLRSRRIYAPEEKHIQANAYFALKTAGGALKGIQGYFNREFMLEGIEHMVDNANYTSVYPHMSLAPEQRFVSKGCYIAQLESGEKARLRAVSEWLIPGAR